MKNGCDLVGVEVPYIPGNAESEFFFGMQGLMAQYQKAKIVANSKRGRRQKVKNGKIPGVRRIYGYTFDKDNDILVENPEERAVYNQMVDWILNGKGQRTDEPYLGCTGVVIAWNSGTERRQVVSGYSQSYSKNPVYTGRFYYGKTEYKQRKGQTAIIKKPEEEWQMVPVPAFIDDVTFDELQRKIKTLSRANRGARPKVTYLLKGLVRCGRCGSAVVAGAPSRSKKTGEIMHHYYVCSGKTRRYLRLALGEKFTNAKVVIGDRM